MQMLLEASVFIDLASIKCHLLQRDRTVFGFVCVVFIWLFPLRWVQIWLWVLILQSFAPCRRVKMCTKLLIAYFPSRQMVAGIWTSTLFWWACQCQTRPPGPPPWTTWGWLPWGWQDSPSCPVRQLLTRCPLGFQTRRWEEPVSVEWDEHLSHTENINKLCWKCINVCKWFI